MRIRFWCYGTSLRALAAAYRNAVLADPTIVAWMRAAREENEQLESFGRCTETA